MGAVEMRTNRDISSLAPVPPWDDPGSHGHVVQFYEDDSFLLDVLSRYVGRAIAAGDSVIVLVTKAHWEELCARLTSRGLDLALAVKEGHFLSLDAAETLAKIMIDGQPDPLRFGHVIGNPVAQLAAAARKEDRRVAAFGELVGVLCADGKPDAAIRLEQLWNELAAVHSFTLLCAYPLNLFSREGDGERIQKILAQHSHVIPAEQYTTAATGEERRRTIISSEQSAKALETEIIGRRNIQETLREREAELNSFLENAVIGMHWVDGNGTILWANKAELDLLGYERDEYVGRQISAFHVDSAVAEDMLQRLSRNEELRGYEARLRCKDGSIRHVRIDSNPFVRDGSVIHARCFITDITEKKHAEQALFRLAAIVESSEDAIVSKDINGIITTWNNSAERIFGYTPDEIVGRSITVLIPPELQAEETLILARIRAGERIDHFQTVRVRKNGERIDVSLTISPVRDRNGKIIGAAKILRDITGQRKLEAALHTSERLASVGRLAATIAHEINNPLEAVTNFIYLAKQQPGLSQKVKQYLETADRELGRVAHIARQTLGFYRDTSQPDSVFVSDVIEDVLTIYERKFKYKELTVEQQIEPGLIVFTVQGELKQVLSNLISNAIDASRDGGKIVIRARATRNFQSGNRGIRITVADNGSGISAKDMENLFVPFFTTKKDVGTGLGLWITKDLLEKKGGHIRFRSSDSQPSGTVMSIYLPLTSPVTLC
jgi:PAS domain S-box-containing protein